MLSTVASANSLDRRQKQKLSRGKVDIDARIDLHGKSVEQARASLRSFLRQARENHGHRNVLVITGKGASPFARHTLHSTDIFHAPERQGRLRVELARWLQEFDMAEHVIGFQPAHPRHGGGGAFYVRLRRKADRS
jgi:DNA-nicking Smr family endonuclease